MKVLLIGGTGLISVGIVKHLKARNATITMINRGQRDDTTGGDVEQLTADRNDASAFAAAVAGRQFDVVIDMFCFTPEQADLSIKLFAGKCKQFIFCSTVCTYGGKIPNGVLVNETFPQEPVSNYGRNKVVCEKKFLDANARGDFAVTIIRPSSTYGPGGHLIDNIQTDPVAWDRIERGLPVLCTGDGLGLWVSTHRDDCGKLFAYACLNERTFGQAYNATRDRVYTWRDLYREAAESLGKTAQLLMVPADWVVAHDPKRFNLLHEITRYHGAYDSSKAQRRCAGVSLRNRLRHRRQANARRPPPARQMGQEQPATRSTTAWSKKPSHSA
ncbi:MAG: NAD-dependent epimerase/dehydratase family protein [Tepidisphaeraceae bacterium]